MTAQHPARQLDHAALSSLGESFDAPTYDRGQLQRSIIHIGVGGFHRAHLATYVDELCRAGNTDWGITGAGVLAQDRAMAEALDAQDYLYSLVTKGPAQTDVRVIGSIVDFISVHRADGSVDPAPLIAAIADPVTQIVSLTVTEGGYPIDDRTGGYQPDSPSAGPRSAFGIIASGLELRRALGGGGLTVLSCDNIVSNGVAAREATLGEAKRIDADLADWISFTSAFPNSMVDRITPATTERDRAWLEETHGLQDRWPVVTEPFRQWVIEDDFAGARLPLEAIDVLATADVEPYELMKLRLLNAGHSCVAYLAALLGIETVDEALSVPELRGYLHAFLESEARPVLPAVPGVDLDLYIESLLERFANPAIGDQIARLCLDGSAKLPKFLLPTVRDQLQASGPVELSALAVAAWCQYLLGDRPSISADPLLDSAIEHATASLEDPCAFLRFAAVFDAELATSDRFASAFVDALSRIRTGGVTSAIELAMQGTGAHDGTNG